MPTAEEMRERLLARGVVWFEMTHVFFQDEHVGGWRAFDEAGSEVELGWTFGSEVVDWLVYSYDHPFYASSRAWDLRHNRIGTFGQHLYLDAESILDVAVYTPTQPRLYRAVLTFPDGGPVSFVECARDDDPFVRCACAEHPATPSDVTRVLLGDIEEVVRSAVAHREVPPSPEDTWRLESYVAVAGDLGALPRDLVTLGRSEWDVVRHRVALNPNAPERILRELAADRRWQVTLAVAANSSCPSDLRELLLGHFLPVLGHAGAALILAQERVPDELLVWYAASEDPVLRAAVAQRQDVPRDVLERLANDFNDVVHETAVRRLWPEPSTPWWPWPGRRWLGNEDQRALAAHRSAQVRVELARQPELLQSVLEALRDDPDPHVRVAAALSLQQRASKLPPALGWYWAARSAGGSRPFILDDPGPEWTAESDDWGVDS